MANTPSDNRTISFDVAVIATGVMCIGSEVLRVFVLINTGHDDPGLVSVVNTLLTVFVGLVSADRLGTVISKVKNGK